MSRYAANTSVSVEASRASIARMYREEIARNRTLERAEARAARSMP